MSNINDMGLPQGLPEMLKEWVPNQHTVPSRYWAAMGDNTQRAYAQDYADRAESENNNRSREMTAADLGFPLPQWTREFVCGLYGDDWFKRTYAEWLMPTPFFWLGAQAETA